MTEKLETVVKVRRRFQRSVRVDTDISAAALEGFVCPQSAADALLSMARQVCEAEQGAFTWTGPYGCGKSSLVVALGALLAEPQLKLLARSSLGATVAAGLERSLDPDGKGWMMLPVVGGRTDPTKAVSAALDNALNIKRGRGRPSKADSDVIERLVEYAGRPDHAGLLVVIDEMGKFLEEAAFGIGADVYFFQLLAEAANRSGGRLIVIGVLHQAFDDYAHRLGREARDEWLKIQGRFADIPINVAGEEQIALIARAIETDAAPPSNQHHSDGIADAIKAQRPGTGSDLGARLNECWPLHPVVASLLGPLSRRRFGQNQRSVFGFLNSAEPFGFQEYLRTEPLDRAVAYDTVHLWDYLRTNLEPSILASSDGHRWSLAVDAVERSEARGADVDHLALVKTIALIDLFKERSGLLPSTDVLRHALPGIDDARIEFCLEELKAWSIILYRRHLGAYAIYAGSDFDIDAAVDEVRVRLPMVDLARLRSLALLQPILAKRHYHKTGALRWFEIDIAALSEGAERIRQFRPQHGATGLFLLLIGTEAESDAKAKKLWRAAAEAGQDWPVAVGWTRDSFMIRELASELLALEAVRSERSELQGDAVARREVSARIARLSAEVEDRLNHAFDGAQWAWRARETAELSTSDGATLNAIASVLADERYWRGPRIKNELLNRIKPSSNAIAAQKELLKAMVERWQEPRLGIEGYPASGGLYDSLLGATGLHAARPNDEGRYNFVDPSNESEHRLAPLWEIAESHFRSAGAAGADLASLYEEWRKPPFGLRDGLLPVFAIAYLMSRSGRLAVYLDSAFQPKVSALLIDRLTQDPASVRLRWTEASDFHVYVLGGIADMVAGFGVLPADQTHPETIDVARGLVGLVLGLPGWALRTGRLSATASKVRNLVKLASDPNKFLLDDIPSVFANGAPQTRDVAEAVVITLRDGLRELVEAYPAMLQELQQAMLRELRIETLTPTALATLHERAEAIKGLTGNYRLDAFATRLSTYSGDDEEIEGLASLAANKPPRDWVDRDVDHARVEIAALAQEFVRAEAFAHVKGREDGRVKMAIFISDPNRPSPVKPDFDIGAAQQRQARMLADELEQFLGDAKVDRNVALAALAELGARLTEADPEPVLPFDTPPQPLPLRPRKEVVR